MRQAISIEEMRADAGLAGRVMEAALPRAAERVVVLGQLLDSIAVAERSAPGAWAVTLFLEGFRLNVGPVEALTFFDGEIRLLMHGTARWRSDVPGLIADAPYKSVPQPQHVYLGSVRQFVRARDQILSAHHAFIREAACTPSGKPRSGTPHQKSHSEGLVECARKLIAATTSGRGRLSRARGTSVE